jgi:anti-sigma factor ChrR (cupin superfamily)
VINSSLSPVLRRIDYSNWKWQVVGVVWVAALRVKGEERIDVALIYREAQPKMSCHGIGL